MTDREFLNTPASFLSPEPSRGSVPGDETAHDREVREAIERLLRRRRLGSLYLNDVRLLRAEINSLRESLNEAEDHIDFIMGEIGGTLPG